MGFWAWEVSKKLPGGRSSVLTEYEPEASHGDPIHAPGRLSIIVNYDPVSRTLEPAIYDPRKFWDPSRKMRLDELVW